MEQKYIKMYEKLPGLTFGFHGCDLKTFKKVIYEGEGLRKSENTYDWLGNGIYFWENSYYRAYDWAEKRFHDQAAVIGAVIDLGYCLNLTDYHSTEVLKMGYRLLEIRCNQAQIPMPQNGKRNKNHDVLLRDLDCSVIEQLHLYNKDKGYEDYDSVRGVFSEGAEVYPGSEFREKTHIQLCIVNPNCIKGYFRPVGIEGEYANP